MAQVYKPRALRGFMQHERSTNGGSGNDDSVYLESGDTFQFTIPKEGAVTTEKDQRDARGKEFTRYFVDLVSESGKKVTLACSKVLCRKIQKVASLYALPVTFKVSRMGSGIDDTRYEINVLNTHP